MGSRKAKYIKCSQRTKDHIQLHNFQKEPQERHNMVFQLWSSFISHLQFFSFLSYALFPVYLFYLFWLEFLINQNQSFWYLITDYFLQRENFQVSNLYVLFPLNGNKLKTLKFIWIFWLQYFQKRNHFLQFYQKVPHLCTSQLQDRLIFYLQNIHIILIR